MTSKLLTLTIVAHLLAGAAFAQSSGSGGTSGSGGSTSGSGSGTTSGGSSDQQGGSSQGGQQGGSGNQSGGDSTTQSTTGDTSDPPGSQAGGTVGSDWSTSLGSAIFSDADRTQLRSADELATQWTTLSSEDRAMIRRDCAAYSADSGTGSTGAASGGLSDTGSASGSTSGSTGGTASGSGSSSTLQVSAAQMQEICASLGSLE